MKFKKVPDPDYNTWCMYLCIGQMFTALSALESGWAAIGFILAGILFDIAAVMCLITIEK